MSKKYTKNSLIRKTHLNTSMTFCPTIIESIFLQRNSLTLMGYEGSCTVMLVTMNPQAKEDIHVRIRQSPKHPDFANSDKIDSLPDNF